MDRPVANCLSLCSGVGWLDEGVRAGFDLLGIESRTVGYCERDSYAAACLLARMEEQSLEPAPIWCGNLEDCDWQPFRGVVDCLVAGFPCQPFSAAGKRKGAKDHRWLWPDIAEAAIVIEPSLLFLENVPGLRSRGGLNLVLDQIAEMGFAAEWCHLTARAVRASHLRERLFILAYAQGRGFPIWQLRSGIETNVASSQCDRRVMADANWLEEYLAQADAFGRAGAALADAGASLGDAQYMPTRNRESRIGRTSNGQERRGSVEAGNASRASVGDSRRHGRSARRTRLHGEATRPQKGTAEDPQLRRAAVADAERCGSEDQREIPAQARQSDARHGGGILAPGPSEDWTNVPWPLWPAIEPGLRVLVDGRALVLDESRTDQLRCAGNGVVQECAAIAFVCLFNRLFSSR